MNRVKELVDSSLAPKTRETYGSIIGMYKDYMYLKGVDDMNPDRENFLKWVAYQSLFIDPSSVSKYVQAVFYYLDTYDRGDIAKNVLIQRMIRSLSMQYGLPVKDDRENLTIDLLLKS